MLRLAEDVSVLAAHKDADAWLLLRRSDVEVEVDALALQLFGPEGELCHKLRRVSPLSK